LPGKLEQATQFFLVPDSKLNVEKINSHFLNKCAMNPFLENASAKNP
jgi:hypothetical protein